MKNLSLILLFSCLTVCLYAQNCYNYSRNKGIELFNAKNYMQAKTYFQEALTCPDKPATHDLNSWIGKCNDQEELKKREEQRKQEELKKREEQRKQEQQRQQEEQRRQEKQKRDQCNQWLNDGKKAYNAGNYSTAKKYFNQGLSSNCDNAVFRQWIADCDSKLQSAISIDSPITKILNLTEVYRLISWNMNSISAQSFGDEKYKGLGADGLGASYWGDRSFYFGKWLKSRRDGLGIYIYPDNDFAMNCPNCHYYVGSWSNNIKSGMGACYDKTGKLIYYGNFSNDKPTPPYPNGNNYGSSQKFGIISYANAQYIGETKDGKEHGQGILLWKEGGMWYGQWENGLAGYGIHIPLTDEITTGYWTGNNYSSTK